MFEEIEEGKIFTISGLAKEFVVSTTRVRDATRRLVAEGALRMSVPGRINSPELNRDRIEVLLRIRSFFQTEFAI